MVRMQHHFSLMKRPERPILLFKYGGNAMTDESLQRDVLRNICSLRENGYDVVIVHGGGPFIAEILDRAGIQSEFIGGQRKTTAEAFGYIEMALKGKVNGRLISLVSGLGYNPVGLSGKDGRMVVATRRRHIAQVEGIATEVDLGQVGDVAEVDPSLIRILLLNGYIPVISCIAADAEGNGMNINGDMFAGHLAGALRASQYIVLTDVDGLLRKKDDPSSLISTTEPEQIRELLRSGVIAGGMIPKIESCLVALQNGANAARIINGTVPERIIGTIEGRETGTLIKN